MDDDQRKNLHETRARLEKLGWWLDSCVKVPYTRIRFGLDAIIGLVPIVGDVVGLGMSAWLMREAHRCGAPRAMLAKMGGNALLDAGAGALPVVGDVFDFFFKANRRNTELLQEHLDIQLSPRPRRRPWALLIGAAICAAGIWWFTR